MQRDGAMLVDRWELFQQLGTIGGITLPICWPGVTHHLQ
jgi:hypothetical protein